ncbi:voltage-dependent potassium channel beta subunit [compost metagenome]
MRGIASQHGASVAQVAITWLLSKRAVTSVLLGASKPHQLKDNLGSADLVLTQAEISVLDAETVPVPVYPNWFIDNLVDQPMTQALGR